MLLIVCLNLVHNGKNSVKELLDPDPDLDDLQTLMVTFLSKDTSLVKKFHHHDQQFLCEVDKHTNAR